MRIKVFYLLTALLLALSGISQQSNVLFENANNAYADGDYKKSIKLYEQILDKGHVSVELYFNLGNAHYKLNNVAESIYYYEKAKQFDPSDKAIKNNLAYAEQMRIDQVEAIEKPKVSQINRQITLALSIENWAWLSILSAFLAFIGLVFYFIKTKTLQKRIFFGVFILLSLLAISSFLLASSQKKMIEDQQYAIIFSDEIKVFQEPNPKSERIFMLHEGTKVELESNFRGFSKIKLADGSTGWIKTEHYKKI
ncbi:MAG: tetratricopeptide repeat protein [Psychroflexus sp.]|nr:tetratricopeptide repeat protein [Psychroflexus sp.]MDR9447593.1 tetratricopeptide repeat protein [Psychroflexus sp.]